MLHVSRCKEADRVTYTHIEKQDIRLSMLYCKMKMFFAYLFQRKRLCMISYNFVKLKSNKIDMKIYNFHILFHCEFKTHLQYLNFFTNIGIFKEKLELVCIK